MARIQAITPEHRRQIETASQHLSRSASKKPQEGFGMIDALVAIVIFALGMAALAALYVRMAPQPYQNGAVMQVQSSANSLVAALTANPSVLPFNGTDVTTASGMPSGLQGWFSQSADVLPGFTVTQFVSGPNASGVACSSSSCGVTVTLSWTQLGLTRSQTFYAQIGLS